MEERLIQIGADEIILWLRKNRISNDIPNDGINGLGIRIYQIIENLGGRKIEDSAPSYWDDTGSHVQQYGLPKTSAQYEINVNRLSELYISLQHIHNI